MRIACANVVSIVLLVNIVKALSAPLSSVPLSFASYYGDHMVLQQAPKRAIIWGYSDVSNMGQNVKVTVGNVAKGSSIIFEGPIQGTAVWRIKLPAITERGPFTVVVQSEQETASLDDVLFGDVWVCSGQSNMQFAMAQVFNATQELEEVSKYPDIRVFTVALKYSAVPLYNLISIEEKWSLPTKASIGNGTFTYFSAVCWLYAKYMYQKRGYPLGMVDTDWGGTPVEAWSSPDALAQCGLNDSTLRFKPRRKLGIIDGPQSKSVLWNAMVHPLLNMTIYGAIWYQGEANAGAPNTYNCTFPAMISDWRGKFHAGSQGETDETFPFGFVQLCGNENNSSIIGGFPDIRWHQTADVGYVPNSIMPRVFMSVAMDLPDFKSPYGSIHPRDKQDVAWRLMLSGLSVAYHQPGIKFQGPMITAFYIDIGFHLLKFDFDNQTSPIVVRNTAGFEVCCSSDNQSSCSELDPRWTAVPITKYDTSSATLSYQACSNSYITGLRYAWRESPCQFKMCAIYSKENDLPAPPFVINGLIGLRLKTWPQIGKHLGQQ